MQRVGALLMGINSLFASIIIIVTVQLAWSGTWTASGVWGSVFGFAVILLVLPTGIAHGVVAIFPNALARWHCTSTPLAKRGMFFFEQLKEMYLGFGQFASICFLASILYLLVW